MNKYEVQTNTIDNIFNSIKLDKSLLKIDVEGFELNVLKGGYNKLDEIPFILVENQFGNHYEDSDHEMVKNFLKEKNFRIIKKFTLPTFHIQDILYKNNKIAVKK